MKKKTKIKMKPGNQTMSRGGTTNKRPSGKEDRDPEIKMPDRNDDDE